MDKINSNKRVFLVFFIMMAVVSFYKDDYSASSQILHCTFFILYEVFHAASLIVKELKTKKS